MSVRLLLPLLLAALAGCSFIDDFSGFTPGADGGLDASESDAATEQDADVPEDAGPDDAGDAAADAASGPGDELCADQTDGTPCGPEQLLICLKGFCRTSRCGDGFVDQTRDEQCDDANLMRGDGCEPASCHYSCTSHAECDNGYACDGDEKCDVRSHSCLRDTVPATNAACTRESGVAGVCDDKGYCVSPGCGDGVVGTGEECDPAAASPTPGCRADCTLGCASNAACQDQDVCNGEETCDTSSGECVAGAALACADGDDCTLDGACDATTGCVYVLIDVDGDLVSPEICKPGSAHQGGDCNDDEDDIHPGAPEYCDGVDNDCDGKRDEDAMEATCYPDRDRDAYPDQQGAMSACTCPEGTRTERTDHAWDCWDDPRNGADVHPGQQNYFGEPYDRPCASGNGGCKSFDYDCSGMATPLYGAGPGMCSVLGSGLTCSGEGYTGAVPACGSNAAYLICEGGGLLRCNSKTETRRQVCH